MSQPRRTIVVDTARQQGRGHAFPVMATVASAVQPPANAVAAPAAAAAPLPELSALEAEALREDEGESEYVSGSSSKRHRGAVLQCQVRCGWEA